MDKTNCHLPFTLHCVQILRFLYSRLFFIRFKPYISPVRLKRWLTYHGQVVSTLGSALLNTGFCLCSYKRTYVLQSRAPESQPRSSVCVTLFHLKQVTNLKVSNIKRRLAHFQSFMERCLPHRRSILRGVHVRKVTTSCVQF